MSWYKKVYLNSSHWKNLRLRIVERAGGNCEKCFRPFEGTPEVHHLRYDLWKEQDCDLLALCHDCHEFEHGRQKVSPRWSWLWKVKEEVPPKLLEKICSLIQAEELAALPAKQIDKTKTHPGINFFWYDKQKGVLAGELSGSAEVKCPQKSWGIRGAASAVQRWFGF